MIALFYKVNDNASKKEFYSSESWLRTTHLSHGFVKKINLWIKAHPNTNPSTCRRTYTLIRRPISTPELCSFSERFATWLGLFMHLSKLDEAPSPWKGAINLTQPNIIDDFLWLTLPNIRRSSVTSRRKCFWWPISFTIHIHMIDAFWLNFMVLSLQLLKLRPCFKGRCPQNDDFTLKTL